MPTRTANRIQMRYFRAAHNAQNQIVHDSYPVMPLTERERSSSPLPTLQMMLEDGDLENAQQLAYGTAQLHGMSFPEPSDLPALNPRVDYTFSLGAANEDFPTLQAVKTWMEGSERRSAVQAIATYGVFEEAQQDERELNEMLQTRGLDATMKYAEWMAESGGYLNDGRDDPRLFTEGPPDPFTTARQRTIHAETVFVNETIGADAQPTSITQDEPDAAVEQLPRQFADSAFQLLEPIHPTVNYSFEALAVDPCTLELTADKWWHDEQRAVMSTTVQPGRPTRLNPEFEREIERERGMMDAEELRRTYQEEGLEAAMRKAESMAVANGELDPNRPDGRLFPDGPPDRFVSLRRAELAGLAAQPLLETGQDITNDDTTEVPVVSAEPGSWEELVQRSNLDESEVERHYWQLRAHPAVTPDGTPLGYALFCTEFPELPPNFDEYVEEYGMDNSIYPTQARTVEMADFKTEAEAKAFSDEFRRYLIPGVIDGPELAPDVAKLEGLSGEWKAMDYPAIVDYMSGSRTVTREPGSMALAPARSKSISSLLKSMTRRSILISSRRARHELGTFVSGSARQSFYPMSSNATVQSVSQMLASVNHHLPKLMWLVYLRLRIFGECERIPLNGSYLDDQEILKLNSFFAHNSFRANLDQRLDHRLHVSIFQASATPNLSDHFVFRQRHQVDLRLICFPSGAQLIQSRQFHVLTSSALRPLSNFRQFRSCGSFDARHPMQRSLADRRHWLHLLTLSAQPAARCSAPAAAARCLLLSQEPASNLRAHRSASAAHSGSPAWRSLARRSGQRSCSCPRSA